MKRQIEIYNLLTKKEFIDELERKYLDKTIQEQYEINSAKSKTGKITSYRSMRELPGEINEKIDKKIFPRSERIDREKDVKYKFEASDKTIEVIVPKEMIEQGKNTRYDFIPETINALEEINQRSKIKYTKNLRIKKNITQIALGTAIIIGSIVGTAKVIDHAKKKKKNRRAQRDKYSTYYDYYKDVMPFDKYVEMVENHNKAYQNVKSK